MGNDGSAVGSLLTWMQEKRDPVFVVATANRIDLLPPELLRKGRFDEIFFVDLPTLAVPQNILAIHLRKKDHDPNSFDLEKLAAQNDGFPVQSWKKRCAKDCLMHSPQGQSFATSHIERAIARTFPAVANDARSD